MTDTNTPPPAEWESSPFRRICAKVAKDFDEKPLPAAAQVVSILGGICAFVTFLAFIAGGPWTLFLLIANATYGIYGTVLAVRFSRIKRRGMLPTRQQIDSLLGAAVVLIFQLGMVGYLFREQIHVWQYHPDQKPVDLPYLIDYPISCVVVCAISSLIGFSAVYSVLGRQIRELILFSDSIIYAVHMEQLRQTQAQAAQQKDKTE